MFVGDTETTTIDYGHAFLALHFQVYAISYYSMFSKLNFVFTDKNDVRSTCQKNALRKLKIKKWIRQDFLTLITFCGGILGWRLILNIKRGKNAFALD